MKIYLLKVDYVLIISKSYIQDNLTQYQGSKGHSATSDVVRGRFGGGMRCWWMDVRYRFLIPMSPQYIDRVFLYLTQKNHLKGFRLSHWCTLAGS
jgi:hypothetical protein